MIIRTATIRNFGPFYGEQAIALFPAERPLTLIHGENMRGKTSLLNAVRWALYGHVRTRTGGLMPSLRLLNTQALHEGTFAFSVDLEIADGSDIYELTRQAHAAREPLKDSDFQMSLHVRKNEVFQSREDGEVQIARLLPETVSHFFLFDGEMLNDFEELLADPTHQSQAIKGSIEQILGVPALQNTINDLSMLHKDAERRQTQAAKSVDATVKDGERAAQLAAQIATAETDVGELNTQLERKREEVSALDDELRRFDVVRAEAEQLDRLREERAGTTAEIAELEEGRRRALSEGWLDVLGLAISPRLEALELERDRLVSVGRKQAEAEARRSILEDGLHRETCQICGSELGEEHKKKIQAALAELSLPDPPQQERLESVLGSIARLRGVKAPGVGPRVESIERNMRRAVVRRTELQNRVTELETKLRDFPLSEISHVQRQRDRLIRELGGYDEALKGALDGLEVLRAQAAAVRTRIAQVSDPELDRLNHEVELYESLLRVFENALNDLLDELKTVIEQDASQVFLKLTTDKSYSGLRINDYYGLYIVDGSGNDVAVRSAGAEQIVALSLIAALNRNAVKRGPVVMDTPFGRLDVRHRTNILSFLSTMADQVVLLVHSGEVDRDRDMRVVAPFVEREYDLHYVSSAVTEIIPLAGSIGGMDA
jgi:DNA sulfur modification protein DndD